MKYINIHNRKYLDANLCLLTGSTLSVGHGSEESENYKPCENTGEAVDLQK